MKCDKQGSRATGFGRGKKLGKSSRLTSYLIFRARILAAQTLFRGVVGTVSRVEVLIRARKSHSRPRLRPQFYRELTENPTGN